MAALHCTQCGLEQPIDARFCPSCGLAVSAQQRRSIGQVVADRYRLLERIGQGASGTVYRAEHTALNKKVAVKLLHHQLSRDEAAVERFRREATTVAELDNDHILQVTDFGHAADGRLFFAMAAFEGNTLRELIEKEERLTVSRSLDIAIQIGEALVEAHGLGYVHRDLKPPNVFLIQRRGRADFVKLLDFGLAKLVEPGGQMHQTALGMTFGDPHYMAPEAVRGDAIDRRVDIYALGAILFEMLTGAPPFGGAGTFEVLQKQLDGAVPKMRDRRPDLPEWLDRVVSKALAKKPDDRFVTALKLIEHLREQGAPASERVEAKPAAKPAAAEPETTREPKLEPRPAGPAPQVGGSVPKETMLLGRLRSPADAEPAATAPAPAPSISPIVSTQKMAPVGKAARQPQQPQQAKKGASGRMARIEGVNLPIDDPQPQGGAPAAVAVSGQAGPAPRLTPKDAAAAPSTSGEMNIGERNREPSQKVPTVMFDSAVEAKEMARRAPAPQPEKLPPRRPGAVSAKPAPKPVAKPFNDSGEIKKPAAEPPAPVVEAQQERRDEPSGESDWFKTGPKIDDEEELEPIQKSRAGMYAGLGVGGVVVAAVLTIALWPRAPKAATEGTDKPVATAAPSVAPAPAAAPPAPAPPAAPVVTTTPLPTPAPVAAAPPAPAPTPVVAAPTPAAPAEEKIVAARVEGTKRGKEERINEEREPEKDKEPKVAAKPAPSKQALDELKPAKEAKPQKALPAGFKDPFAEAAPVARDAGAAASMVKLGRQKLSAGDINGALAQFNKAREADPGSADALAGMGEVSFEQGDYNAAAGYLKQALRYSPNRPRYIVLLGQAYYKLGRARDAANEYRRALRLDPDNEEAQRSLELAEKKLGN